MRKSLTAYMLLFVILLGILPESAFAAPKGAPKPLYDAIITRNYPGSTTSIYEKPDKDSRVLEKKRPGARIKVVDVWPEYVSVLCGKGIGYVLRKRIDEVKPIDPVNTPPYGAAVNRYYVTVDRDTPVLASPKDGAEPLITLTKGAKIGFLYIKNGYGVTIFKRRYGYVDTRLLPELEMVAERAELGTQDIPIAVYNSFYSIDDTELNQNRMTNLKVCGQYMDRVMQPGEQLDFNNSVGPFTRSKGYLEAGALKNGEWSTAVGGGSCQASSTLYNVVLQLTGLSVLKRAPHGADGARYLPHGVDASSGDLNFIFRNDYSFPITIRTHVQDGSLFVAVYKGALQ